MYRLSVKQSRYKSRTGQIFMEKFPLTMSIGSAFCLERNEMYFKFDSD